MEEQVADMEADVGAAVPEEDEDVLHTIPVFLCQELAQSLYMLQYPLRPVDRPYQDDLGAWRTGVVSDLRAVCNVSERLVHPMFYCHALFQCYVCPERKLVQAGRLARVRMKPEHKTLEVNYDLDVRSDNFDVASEQHTERMRLLSRVVPPKTNYAIGMFRADGGGMYRFTIVHWLGRRRHQVCYRLTLVLDSLMRGALHIRIRRPIALDPTTCHVANAPRISVH
jgi:hypothetical protein